MIKTYNCNGRDRYIKPREAFANLESTPSDDGGEIVWFPDGRGICVFVRKISETSFGAVVLSIFSKNKLNESQIKRFISGSTTFPIEIEKIVYVPQLLDAVPLDCSNIEGSFNTLSYDNTQIKIIHTLYNGDTKYFFDNGIMVNFLKRSNFSKKIKTWISDDRDMIQFLNTEPYLKRLFDFEKWIMDRDVNANIPIRSTFTHSQFKPLKSFLKSLDIDKLTEIYDNISSSCCEKILDRYKMINNHMNHVKSKNNNVIFNYNNIQSVHDLTRPVGHNFKIFGLNVVHYNISSIRIIYSLICALGYKSRFEADLERLQLSSC